MADAISFDESFWIEEIDDTDPNSLSSVSVDYTPAFNLSGCFKENFELYLKYLALLDPVEADVLILHYYNEKKVKEIAKIFRTTPVKISSLVHQAEQRLAILLHVNLLLTDDVVEEISSHLHTDTDRKVFSTFLREVSRRRSAHMLGLSFHQVTSILSRIIASLEASDPSVELADLLKLSHTIIDPPRETRQLDETDRVCIYDTITCPQQVNINPSEAQPSYTLGFFVGTNADIWKYSNKTQAVDSAAYFSVNQSIIAHQLSEVVTDRNLWAYITPNFVTKLVSVSPANPTKLKVEPVSFPQFTFSTQKVQRLTPHPPTVKLITRPQRRHPVVSNPYSHSRTLFDIMSEEVSSLGN